LLLACATGAEVTSDTPLGGGGSDAEEEAGSGGKGGSGAKGGASTKGGSDGGSGKGGGEAGAKSGGAGGVSGGGGKATLKGGAAGARASSRGGYSGKGGNSAKGGAGGKGGKAGAAGPEPSSGTGGTGEGGEGGEGGAPAAGGGGATSGIAGSAGSAGSEAAGAAGAGAVDCARDACIEGSALDPSCSAEHKIVCDYDDFCCDSVDGKWDDSCAAYGGAVIGCGGKQSGLLACVATYAFKVYNASCQTCVDACVVDAGYNEACDYGFFDAEAECNYLCEGDQECFCGCATLYGYGQYPAGCSDAETATGCCTAASKAYACAAETCADVCD